MTLEQLGNLGELIGSVGVILSLVYLGRQIQQQNTITRAQFGHSLTQRLYERYFQTSKDEDYARFMATDWASEDLTEVDSWRIQMAILTYLVDLFDVYDKVAAGLVDSSHLETRLNTLRLGVMKTANAKVVWSYWKHNRSQEFIDWFEEAIYGDETLQSSGATSLSPEEIAAQGIKLNTTR